MCYFKLMVFIYKFLKSEKSRIFSGSSNKSYRIPGSKKPNSQNQDQYQKQIPKLKDNRISRNYKGTFTGQRNPLEMDLKPANQHTQNQSTQTPENGNKPPFKQKNTSYKSGRCPHALKYLNIISLVNN